MKTLILIKHSTPQVVEGIPARGWNLSEEGRIRAQSLTRLLAAYHPEVVISSDESKAIQTAEIIIDQMRLPYHVIENLHEHDRRYSPYYRKSEFQRLMQEFFAKPDELVFGTETANEALERFCTAIEKIVDQFNNKSVAIVAHGTVISLFVEWLTGSDGHKLWQELTLPAIVLLDW